MSYEVTGKLIWKGDVEQKTESFQAREFAIETPDDKYPQAIKFQLVQARCDIIEPYKEGQEIKVHFDLRGREWNGKYFTNLNAWKVEGDSPAVSSKPAKKKEPAPAFPGSREEIGKDDDLPF